MKSTMETRDVRFFSGDFASGPVGRERLELVEANALADPAGGEDEFRLLACILAKEILA